MSRLNRALIAAALVALLAPVAVFAGGSLQTIDTTSPIPSGDPNFVLVDTVNIRWDVRCIPVAYSMNDTIDPIPNPAGPPILTRADAQAAFQVAFDKWNDIPTSFIDMQITGTTSNPGTRGFDFVNELTFRTPPGFGAIASSPSVSLTGDSFLPDGADIDGDGDSDVSNAIATCADVDNDGDIEFPEGVYAAGTILDNDVQYNTALRYTTDPADADNLTFSVDLIGVAAHEFGHSHGRSHVPNNQKSDNLGFGATMYPFIDTGDPDSELEIRDLDSDDIAWTAMDYPEGTAASGPPALQAGDVAFDSAYTLITGSVTDGNTGFPVVGAAVGAFSGNDDTLVTTAYSGTARLALRTDGALFFPFDEASGIVHGDYVLPVARGKYSVGMEAIDGTPISANQINFDVQVGNFFGQQNFQEEFYNGGSESAFEKDAGKANPVNANNGNAGSGIDLVTNVNATVAPYGSFDFYGFTLGPGGLIYAVQFPRAEVQAAFDSGLDLLQMATYRTQLFDASAVPIFSQAALVTGTVNGNGSASLDLDNPFRREAPFIGQDADFAPYYFSNSQQLTSKVQQWLANGPADEDLFLILQIPQPPWPGFNNRAPGIGLDGRPGGVNDAPILGRSFLSLDNGASFFPETRFNFMFALVFTEN